MKATFLGTGTSVGVPVIGCDCAVCRSDDPRNKRKRTSLYVEGGGVHVVIDTSTDFREQCLAFGVPRVDAVLITHSHADHIFGFDDVRRFNTIQKAIIPVYGNAETIADMRRVFGYAEKRDVEPGVFRPAADFTVIDGPFRIGGMDVEPLPVTHGDRPTLGYRLSADGQTIGYVPDCGRMDDEIVDRLAGVDVMILDALKRTPHTTHLSLEESVSILERIGADRSFIVHLCHDLDHDETQNELPDGMTVPYDGLSIDV